MDFDGLRRTFITRMEGSGVPVSTAKLIVGHARADMTYGNYSTGLPLKALADAVAKVGYGAVDGIASTLGDAFTVTKRAH